MKRLIMIFVVLLMIVGLMAGCNRQLFDTTYEFDRAIVSFPDGTVVSGEVESWTDYSDGDHIQVKINGVIYLVHSSQIVLIRE